MEYYTTWQALAILMSLRPRLHVSATFSFRIQKFPRPQVSLFKLNLPVHTYPTRMNTRMRIYFSTQDFSGTIGNRASFVKTGKRENVWTEVVSGRKKLRIQKYPDLCGRLGPDSPTELSAVPNHLSYETIS